MPSPAPSSPSLPLTSSSPATSVLLGPSKPLPHQDLSTCCSVCLKCSSSHYLRGLCLDFLRSLLKCSLIREAFHGHPLLNSHPPSPGCFLSPLFCLTILHSTCSHLTDSKCILLSVWHTARMQASRGQGVCFIPCHILASGPERDKLGSTDYVSGEWMNEQTIRKHTFCLS